MTIISAGKKDSKYDIFICGESIPKVKLNEHLNVKNKILIITDHGVPGKHVKKLKSLIKNQNIYIYKVKAGEKSKSFKSYQSIINKLFELKFDRTDTIIAFGGGVIGDLTGFCAATFLRGIKYIQIPTTLLSQVDSSVGGKTAINVPQGKNLVGSFYNPSFVLISTGFLKTLPENEYQSGLGEIVKYALIGNKKLKKIIQDNYKSIIKRNGKVLELIIEESIKTKSKIVTQDEKENGIRAILNFGHTFGHAIEAFSNYKKITHGAAITLGMVIAAKVSFYEGHIKESKLREAINLIRLLGLDINHHKYKYVDLKQYIKTDKKVSEGKLNLILIDNKFNAFKTSKFNSRNIVKAMC